MLECFRNSSRCCECGCLMLYQNNEYQICNECINKKKVSTCKVIDLLNKIANDEKLPKRIMFRNHIYYLEKDNNYHDNYYGESYDDSLFFFDDNNAKDFLNEKVEILKDEDCEDDHDEY